VGREAASGRGKTKRSKRTAGEKKRIGLTRTWSWDEVFWGGGSRRGHTFVVDSRVAGEKVYCKGKWAGNRAGGLLAERDETGWGEEGG